MKPTILAVGIAVLDDVYALNLPLRPGEKHRAVSQTTVIGGSATNAALAIARLGGTARLITRLGEDAGGAQLRAALEAEGVDLSLSPACAGCRTSRSAIVIEPGGDRTIINFLDPSLPIAPDWLPKTLPLGVDVLLADVRWEEAATDLFEAAREKGIPRVLDGDRAPARPDLIALSSHCVFSAQALRELTKIDALELALPAFAAGRSGYFAVTDGANGVFSFEDDNLRHYPAFAITPVDTLGAGDVWHGAFALAIGQNQPLGAAIRFASAAAALKCTRPGGGSAAPNARDLSDFLKEHAE